MHVALEATPLTDRQPTGIPRYARQLMLALAELPEARDTRFTLIYRNSRWRRRHLLPAHPRLALKAWRGLFWARRDYDVVHNVQHRYPPWREPRRVATLHDLYAMVGVNHDNARDRAKQTAVYRSLARESDQIIFVSENTRRDFERLIGGVESDRLHVTPLGVGPEFCPQPDAVIEEIRARFGLREPYLLFLGWKNPNKNLARLLEAFARSRARRDFQLVLAGRIDSGRRQALDARVNELGIAGRVVMPGYVSENDVPALYAAAAALMFPSLYEGFGLPILEGMASGIPVMTSTVSSCPETAAGHAVLVDPLSLDEMALGIDRTLALPAEARGAAMTYAHSMTWARTARLTLEVYRQALAAPPRRR